MTIKDTYTDTDWRFETKSLWLSDQISFAMGNETVSFRPSNVSAVHAVANRSDRCYVELFTNEPDTGISEFVASTGVFDVVDSIRAQSTHSFNIWLDSDSMVAIANRFDSIAGFTSWVDPSLKESN